MPKVKGTPTVRFTLFSTKEPLKPTYITLYFHYRGKRLKYSTGEKVCPDGWDFAKQRAICNRKYPEGADINTALNKLEEFTKSIYRNTGLGNIAPADFSHELDVRMGYEVRETEVKQPTPSLLAFTEGYLSKYVKDFPDRRSTYKVMFLTLKQLKGYAADKGVKLDFAEINNGFLSDLIVWLFAPPRGYSHNYAAGVVKRLKMFMQKAFEGGLHDNRIYLGFKLTEIDSDEIAIGFEELHHLFKIDFSANQHFERVRDIFLIGCFTGLRFGDYNRIRPEHIIEESGLKMLSITTEKTGAKVKVPLYPILEKLLRKYDFNIPVIKQQVFNRSIKEVCRFAGLTDTILIKENKGGQESEKEVSRFTMISTHTARRSFATNFILAKIPVHLVMAIMAHKTEAQTRKYARISESQTAKGFSLEIEKLKESPDAAYLFQ